MKIFTSELMSFIMSLSVTSLTTDSLMQTQSDQKLSLDMRSRLIGELNYIAASATEQIKNTDTYRKYTDDLMKS
jgi:hypothetical protein